MTIGKAMEREVNSIPIGFLYDKSNVDGNPLLRILSPSSLKGMNASDRAPRGLFTIPDLPEEHFNKVQTAYNLWAQCWATSYLPTILDRQKWNDADPNLAVNDVVLFKMDDSVLKIDWRIGKVDSVKIGRDGKIREVNIAYKIMKDDDHWRHNVVTRPTREIIKLFEIEDTTFADDMKAVRKIAKQILISRGALDLSTREPSDGPGQDQTEEVLENLYETDGTRPNSIQDLRAAIDASNSGQTYRHTSTNSSYISINEDLCLSESRTNHQPFLSCFTSEDWYQMGIEAGCDEKTVPVFDDGDVLGVGEVEGSSDTDEILFLL